MTTNEIPIESKKKKSARIPIGKKGRDLQKYPP